MRPEDPRWMAVALSLGARGLGRVWPNPAVGCVIVADGRVVGRGWTQPGGRPHAETQALAQAGAAARGATAYVSLEPCAHHGQTPPCALALTRAGVARVVSALQDPDPRVDGGGHQMLRDAGITVDSGVMADAAARAHRGFVSRVARGRPHLTLKLATSLDGRIATASGQSQWITGPGARRLGHGLRARHDAVLVGGGTARADDPSLTVRDMGPRPQPVRVVLSRRLDLPRDGVLARTAREVPLWLCHGDGMAADETESWREMGARLIPCQMGAAGQIDPRVALTEMAAAGLTSVLCEGGGVLAASLLQADLVDELVLFTAGLTIGAEGTPGLGAMGIAALNEAPRFDLESHRRVGPDTMSTWQRTTS